MKSLQSLMQKQLQQGGIAVTYGRHSFMEVVEVATGRVWMSVEPATQQDYDLLLAEMDDAFRGVGVGDASMLLYGALEKPPAWTVTYAFVVGAWRGYCATLLALIAVDL